MENQNQQAQAAQPLTPEVASSTVQVLAVLTSKPGPAIMCKSDKNASLSI